MTIEELYNALPTGEDNAIHQVELAEKFDVKPAHVKEMIRAARRQNIEICSSRNGYFVPENDLERQQFAQFMIKSAKSRFVSVKTTRSKLKEKGVHD